MKNLTAEQKLGIAKYFNDKMKVKDIAPLYGLTTDEVYSVIGSLRKKGISIPNRFNKTVTRKQKMWTPEEKQRLSVDYLKGIHVKTLARNYGTTVASVYTIMHDMGIARAARRGKKELLPKVSDIENELYGAGTFKYTYEQGEPELELESPIERIMVSMPYISYTDVTLWKWVKAKIAKFLFWILS